MAVSPLVSMLMTIFSVLVPGKMWYGPNQPMGFTVSTKAPTSLVLCTLAGKAVGDPVDVPADGKVADLKAVFPAVTKPGTYVLMAIPKGKTAADFLGTPVVIEARASKEPGGPPGVMVYRLRPLQYAVMTTDAGAMTMAFDYDVAPLTVESFLTLSGQGYYDGLTFHRIVPGFVLQGGDPVGSGNGGPGYTIPAEFNDHQHLEGVLSMARTAEPDSAGSQFFVCLDYTGTQQLDGKYTVFGRVTEGLDVMKKLAATPIADKVTNRPVDPPVIQKVEVFQVTPGHNPYAAMGLGK